VVFYLMIGFDNPFDDPLVVAALKWLQKIEQGWEFNKIAAIVENFYESNFFLEICSIIFILLIIAFFTLFERKLMALVQRRRGPNIVGFYGLLQPIMDGIKLIFKESILPLYANKILFYFAPILTFVLSGWLWFFFFFMILFLFVILWSCRYFRRHFR
jgi:hypothetical protein